MSTLLTYGRRVPEDGERNFWDVLEDNIERDDGHTHNGVDSAQLSPSDFVRDSSLLDSANWVSDGNGTYHQDVDLPAGYSMLRVMIYFIITSSGHTIYPTVEKLTNSSYRVYVNDNTLGLTAHYG